MGAPENVVYAGTHQIKNVLLPMMISVSMNVYLRPTRSPNLPKTRAPKGRTIKPAANVASVARKAALGLPGGKNFSEMIVAKLPKM